MLSVYALLPLQTGYSAYYIPNNIIIGVDYMHPDLIKNYVSNKSLSDEMVVKKV